MKIVKLIGLTAILLLSCSGLFAQLEWVAFEGEIPTNAVIGGVEGNRSLAVCRCDYQGAMHPGKVVEGACNIGYGGAEKIITNFEVLINKGVVELDWVKSDGPLPDHAIQAGNENGILLYVARAYHEKNTHPGKAFKAGNKYICNIGYGGKELTNTTFEVLVENKPKEAQHTDHDNRCMTDSTYHLVSYIGTMTKNQQINEGSSLVSSNLKYGTRVTDDGRLIIEEILEHGFCDDGRILIFRSKEIWANTDQKGDAALDYYLKFQEDGNLCIYSEQNGFVWCSMSNGQDGHHLELSNIGHIEVVNSHGGEIWPD